MTVEYPFAATSGADIRNFAIAMASKSLGDFLNLSLSGEKLRSEPDGIDSRILGSKGSGKLSHMRNSGHPTVLTFSAAQCEEVEREVKIFKPDIVILEGVALAELMPAFKKLGIPIILDMHNIESALLKDQTSQFSLFKRLFRGHNFAEQIKAAERDDIDAAHLATSVWVCSDADQAALFDLTPDETARIIPNPIPNENLFNIPIEEQRYRFAHMTYIGHLFYFPNVDAISQFIDEGMPNFLNSDGKFVVAGRSPNRKIRKLCKGPQIELIENPADVQPLLAKSAFAPLPMRFGGGTRIKVLEAMAAGVVVCASAKAVEGLTIVEGEHFIRADSAQMVAREILHLTKNPAKAVQIAQSARQFVRENHTFDLIRSAVCEELKASSL